MAHIYTDKQTKWIFFNSWCGHRASLWLQQFVWALTRTSYWSYPAECSSMPLERPPKVRFWFWSASQPVFASQLPRGSQSVKDPVILEAFWVGEHVALETSPSDELFCRQEDEEVDHTVVDLCGKGRHLAEKRSREPVFLQQMEEDFLLGSWRIQQNSSGLQFALTGREHHHWHNLNKKGR